jgi:hypothetical protein
LISNADDIAAQNAVAVVLLRMLWCAADDIGSRGIPANRFASWRQIEAKHAIENPSMIQAKVRPTQVYVRCDGIMYCTNEREPCPTEPLKKRML